MKKLWSIVFSIISPILLSSCANQDFLSDNVESPITTIYNITETTSLESSTISVSDRIVIGKNGFTIEIPNDFKYVGTEDCYELTLQNQDKVYFRFAEWVMYFADHTDITPNELAKELQNNLEFTFRAEKDASAQQKLFCLSPTSSVNLNVNGYLFEYQCGTMSYEGNSEIDYYYEAYFGVVPCKYKNSTFDIEKEPAFWYVFANSQNEDTMKYVHNVIEEIAASVSYPL